MEIYKIIVLTSLLLGLNFLIKKRKILIDQINFGAHKIRHSEIIPLSGGLYFLSILTLLLIFNFSLLKIEIIFFSSLITTIGLFADLKPNFSPRLRLLFQSIICLTTVIFFDLSINKVNIIMLDEFLKNSFFNYLFTTFCIITLINGCNFCDGVNLNISLYLFMTLVVVYFLIQKLNLNSTIINKDELIYIIYGLFIFIIFNFFSLNFLGDNGIYFLSFFTGITVIDLVQQNQNLSPFFAVIILWYPAFENLFSIIRKKIQNIETSRSDKNHLHTKLYNLLTIVFKFSKKTTNSLTGLLINLTMLPCFFVSYYFYNNSLVLLITVIGFIFIYIVSYILIIKLN